MSGKLNKTICTLTSYLFALALDSSGYVVCLAEKSAGTPVSHSHAHIHQSQDNEPDHQHHDLSTHLSQDIVAINPHPGTHLEFAILGSHLLEWRSYAQTELNLEKPTSYLPYYSVLPLNEWYQFTKFHPINTSQINAHPAKKTTVLLL